MKKYTFLLLLIACTSLSYAQGVFSVATDFSVLRNLGKNQGFWAVGQDVRIEYQWTEKLSAYTLVNYYTNGKINSTSTAATKNYSTAPFFYTYDATSKLRYRQISIGLKQYLKGQYNSETGYNIYGFAGFGLLFGNVTTTTSQPIDTSLYTAQPIAGTGPFKRLTVDLGAGGEVRLGSSIYLYAELRAWFPASDNPSLLLYNNDLPRVISLNTGIRILID